MDRSTALSYASRGVSNRRPASGHCVLEGRSEERAHPDDRYADVSVDTARAHAIYREWLARARPAPGPGGLRRPLWLLRPYKPDPRGYTIPHTPPPEGR